MKPTIHVKIAFSLMTLSLMKNGNYLQNKILSIIFEGKQVS